MNDKTSELILKIKSSNNILVTTSHNPSLDQLAACLGLTIFVNKLGKHGSGVYSGQTPSILDFLKPESTLEKNTDSLRDFIITLSKDKADKLRYKLDGDKVKIFITPYKTSITQNDLEFGQGDFNVDLVIILGAVSKQDVDQAILVNERILHDATVVTINTDHKSDFGLINLLEPNKSSLCELVASLCLKIDQSIFDEQIATAFLTGIVAETARFSNQKTTADTLSISSNLLSFGANQQLVADQLDSSNIVPKNEDSSDQNSPDNKVNHQNPNGNLVIEHPQNLSTDQKGDNSVTNVFKAAEDLGQKTVTEHDDQSFTNQEKNDDLNNEKIIQDDKIDQTSPISANIKPEPLDPSLDPLSGHPILDSSKNDFSLPQPVDNLLSNQPKTPIPNPTEQNLSDSNASIKELINDDQQVSSDHVDQIRQEVKSALNDNDKPLQPVMALNAQRLGEIDHSSLDNNDQNNKQDGDDQFEDNSEISINENGEIINHEIDQKLSSSNLNQNLGSRGHELKINPIHDLSSSKNKLDNPPPVPPPIPMNFNT